MLINKDSTIKKERVHRRVDKSYAPFQISKKMRGEETAKIAVAMATEAELWHYPVLSAKHS